MSGTDARLGRWLDLVGELLRRPLAELPCREIDTEPAATSNAYATVLHTVDATGRHVLQAHLTVLTTARPQELRPCGDLGPLARWGCCSTRSTRPQTSGPVPTAIADRPSVAEWRRSTRPSGPTEHRCVPLHSCGRERPAVEEARLTGRELTVLHLLAEGLTAEAIGRRLAISTRTVHKHLEHVYAKFGTGDRLTTVLRAQHAGLLP